MKGTERLASEPIDNELSRFREAYLDFVEGSRVDPPRLGGMTAQQRLTAAAFIRSTADTRGVDPHAERPALDEMLARAGPSSAIAALEPGVDPA